MKNPLTAEISITIHSSPSEVWKAITTPEIIKKYLMGTTVTSDWKEGSSINYEGEYNGKHYNDKGVIQKLEENKLFQSTYLSSMSGKEDKPENYNVVTYYLTEKGDQTVVKLTQDNISSIKEKEASTTNWKMVLEKLKEVVENPESKHQS